MTSTVRSSNDNAGRMKRADQRASITVLVLGDEGVGKSSLISTFVSRYFSEVVPGIMTRVRLPPDPNSSCITTIVDSQGADSALLSAVATMSLSGAGATSTDSFSSFMQRAEASRISSASKIPQASQATAAGTSSSASSAGIDNVDSIILVYDLDRVETFFRLENHWLPLIERCYNGELPVIIAGNKMDLFRPSVTAGMTDEQALARSRQQIVSLMQRFRFVRQCIKCSAKNLLRVDEVFLKAQQAVLYPFPPLYDLDNGRLTAACRRAFTRIFRMYDADNDGLLSDPELDCFHRETFRVPVIDRDFASWKKVVSRNNPTDEEVVRDGKFTIPGFLAIFDVFISQNKLDVVWQALRNFGYDDDLNLHIPESITAPADEKVEQNWRLTPAARSFLSDLFHQFDTDRDGYITADDLLAIFSILPEPSLPPWHPRRAPEVFKNCSSMPKIPAAGSRPDSPGGGNGGGTMSFAMSQSLSASGITILSSDSLPTVNMSTPQTLSAPLSYLDWMGFWHTMSSISPSVTRAELYKLGHVEKKNSKPRGRTRRSVSPSERTPDATLPSREIRVLVLGNATSGKTDLVNALCSLDGVDTSAYLLIRKAVSKTYPETSSAHIRMKRKVPSIKPSKSDDGEEFVLYLVFTEFLQMDPAKNMEHQQELAEYLGTEDSRKCDLVMLVFDSCDEASFFYVKEIESLMLGEDIPRVYVGVEAESEETNNDDDSVQPATVMDNATIHCRELDLEPPLLISGDTMHHFAGDPGVPERHSVLKHLARCALNEQGVKHLRSKPYAEKKQKDSARRRKLMWFGGLVSVSVVVAAGVGLLLGTTVKGERKDRFSWVTRILFGSGCGERTTATK